MTDQRPQGYPDPFAFWQTAMTFWVDAMVSMNRESLRFWQSPFAPPLPDEREVENDLDIPGPLEREFEHNLHA